MIQRANLLTSLAAVLLAASVHAQVAVDLGSQFSINNGNPNGQWSYTDGNQLLSLQIPVNNGNPLYAAVSNGYWGKGNDLNQNTPDLFKGQVDGSNAGETNLDFLTGDIVGHSPNDGTTLFVTWTAPAAGTITDIAMSVWYAHSVVNRSNDYILLDNSQTLTSGTVSTTSNSNRSNPASYSNVGGFTVAAGDVISLGLTKSSGQSYGSLAGESLSFTYTQSVPEPASLISLGIGALAVMRKRHKKA